MIDSSWPSVDHGAIRRECVRQGFEVCFVARENRVLQADREDHDVRIDDVTGTSACEQEAYRSPVVEWMDFDRLEKRRQSSLTLTISPYLSNNGIGRVQRNTTPLKRRDQDTGRLLVAINRDEKPSVENHRL